MISAAGAAGRRMPSAARRSACWIAWCQALLLGASALVIVAERSARKWALNPQHVAGGWCAGVSYELKLDLRVNAAAAAARAVCRFL